MIVGAWLLLAGGVRAKQPSHVEDDTAVRAVIQRYMDARNSRSGEATRPLFTDDADQLVSSGEWRRGIDALVKGAMASSKKELGESSITVESVRFLTSDVAVADGRYETHSAANGTARKMWTTLIVKRTPLGWRIAAIRNMLPAAPIARGAAALVN